MWELERSLFDRGIKVIAGVDEAGRGPLAGPVVAAAVIIPPDYNFVTKIADSKKLTVRQRQASFDEIKQNCEYSYSVISEQDIDRDNILNASLYAMGQALTKLKTEPEWVLVDGPHCPDIKYPCSPIINGDAKSISIASASIMAKVIRDAIMLKYDKIYPEYGFASHKGYGTKAHFKAISEYGPCPIHRKTFQPIKSLLKQHASL